MKNSNLLKISIATLLFTMVAAAQQLCATVIYEDDFTGTSGTLNVGRHPTLVDWNNTTYSGQGTTNTNYFVLDGSGHLRTNTSGSALPTSIALPSIAQGDILTFTITGRASTDTSGFIAVGFTETNGTLSTTNTDHLAVRVNQAGTAQTYQGGLATANMIGSSKTIGVTTTGATKTTDVFTIVLTVDASSENVLLTTTITTTALGTQTLYSDSISVNLDDLNFATIQFGGQNYTGTYGYIDNLSVAVTTIPEASATAFVLVAVLGVLVTRARRNRA